MKLKTGQTIRIGFAFLSICAFWQLYNNVIPLILTNTFHMNETYSGIIMAMDNVLAVFLLPVFGAISDRTDTPMGKRKPFILFGTIAAVILMMLLPVLDNLYAGSNTPVFMILFIVVLGLILITMGVYRSPAVALMSDVTPKPLRSRANAIINLMGALGVIMYLIIATLLYSEKRTAGLTHVNYLLLFFIVAVIMLVSLAIVMLTVDEPKLSMEMKTYEAAHPEENLAVENEAGVEELPKDVKRSLIFILLSIAFWFIAYNAVETWFTTYASRIWGMSLGAASACLTVTAVGAIVSYIPAGTLAEKVGRKKAILFGVGLVIFPFTAAFIHTIAIDHFTPVFYVLFALVGIGWAFINVNSLPMVVEMCKGGDIGKFTGTYYTFSMSAQIITPILSGWLLKHVGYVSLFPYSAFFMILAFITMQFVKHGDAKPIARKGLEAYDVDD